MEDYEKEIEELEARRREVGRELRRKKEGAPRRKLVKEGMELDRKIGRLKAGQPKKVVPYVKSSAPKKAVPQAKSSAPKMSTATIGRGRATHLVQEPKEGRTRPPKTLCGITLMGEHTYPTENRNLERFLRSIEEDVYPLCALCRGRLKGRLKRRGSGFYKD